MFCTLPFTKDQKVYIYLGHAKGDLMNLHMEQPVLSPREVVADDGTQYIRGYKEFCPVPPNSEGIYHHLVESNIIRGEMWYSTIAAVKARDYDGPWEDEGDIIDPLKIKEKFADFVNSDDDYLWCGGHVSPCRILPSEFVDGGRFKMGIINGREKTVDGTFGKFRPGLFLYDPENGTIPWVDPRPLFDDPDAQTVIFASDVVIHKDKDNNSEQSATLITHIDDAYIQHYDISASTIKSRLPRNLTV
jgi:hypothetical protein